ncbi:hypothetical protein DEO72_LG5g2099 [Vigna unguiculata]|uniref:Uncharacterized protein n=1 Tax=Vigna unguiculata TaxID=3917 RepID=A0A4D6M0E0_VIGUN|nr:hypothetical protein DEO72_LG5g2099 [Vigna unguiculata]
MGGGVVLGLGDDVGGGVVSDVVDHGVVDSGGVVVVLGGTCLKALVGIECCVRFFVPRYPMKTLSAV